MLQDDRSPLAASRVVLAALGALVAVVLIPPNIFAAEPLPQTVEFNRDIRPLLSDTCYKCHGPDSVERQADFRLDTQTGLYADHDDYRIVVAGRPDESELFRRISAVDDDERMPPVDSGKSLSKEQIELIRRWIEQGAKWQEHWSFIAPKQPPLPNVEQSDWLRNPIDAFVLARLEQEGLSPSPEAIRTTLLRRVTLDVTGLPPTRAEIEAFLADTSSDAYEKVVDRLLKSSRYGERMAAEWLNAARFADTSGYQNDGPRYMWRWRDWVIKAFNANMPFDQFTIEQLAGDMLPNPTLEQRIATGFNRNHRGNSEGGVIPEEFQVEYVVDRVETTATVWLGLTLGCTRCHDHKFDPFSQKEFYQLFAYFNNIPENGRAIKEGNSPPYIQAPTPQLRSQLHKLQDQQAAAEQAFQDLEPQIAQSQSAWETAFAKQVQEDTQLVSVDWLDPTGLIVHYTFDSHANDELDHRRQASIEDGEAVYQSGKLGQAGVFDGKRFVNVGEVADFGYFDKFSMAAWIKPDGPKGGTIVSKMTDEAQADGYYLSLIDGRLQANLVKRWLDDCIRVETERTLSPDRWYHVAMTYDGTRKASGITVYIDGRPEKLRVHYDFLNQTFTAKDVPLRIGGGGGPQGRFQGLIDDVRIYDDWLPPKAVELAATSESITEIVSQPRESRSKTQSRKLREYFLAQQAPDHIQQAHRKLLDLRKRTKQFVENLPTVMVMQEMERPRDTYVLKRGEYDKPGAQVMAALPASLSPLPAAASNNRLGLARWLVDPSHPLTARVQVNRHWQMFFGTGLVKTAEDFGSQGERPSHPQLLDWLAAEFIGNGWDVKGLQKLMLTSATYRQSSKVTPELMQRDPQNRLLARGSRFRLSAEMVRDQALFVAGLLTERRGGPSVKPYQPAGLWKEIATDTEYDQSHGPDLYRRSLYTYWKRTVASPTMMTFDASARETCIVLPTRTNTPLQALTLMNDVTFVEAARVLAERIMTEGGTAPEERLTHAFLLAASRRPKPAELDILVRGLQEHEGAYSADEKAALELISAGEAPRNESLDVGELAAYTAVAGLILNLDEVVTKE